jgi:hypothetical protein
LTQLLGGEAAQVARQARQRIFLDAFGAPRIRARIAGEGFGFEPRVDDSRIGHVRAAHCGMAFQPGQTMVQAEIEG